MEAAPSSPPARSTLERLERLLVPAGAAAALVFALVGLGRSIWIDEAFSALLVVRRVAEIPEGLRNDGNFPAYFLLLAGWVRAAGISEIALRIPSVVFYLAGIGAVGALGAAAFDDRRSGAWAAFFYLVSQLAFRHAQNARPYAMMALIVAVSHLLYLRVFFRDGATARWRIAFVAVNALGALTHVWFLFVLAAQGAGLLLCGSRRRFLAGTAMLAGSVVPFCILWLPSFIAQIRNGNSAWIPPLRRTITEVAYDYYHPVLTTALTFVLPALLIVGRRRAAELARSPSCLALLVLFGVSLAIPLAISAVHPIYVPDRYAVIALPPLAALLGAGVAQLAPGAARLAVAAAALGLSLHDHVSTRDRVLRFTLDEGQSDRATTRFVLDRSRPGDVLLFTSLSRLAIDYYLVRNAASDRFVERTFPAEIDAHPCWRKLYPDRAHLPALAAEAESLAAEAEHLARTRGAQVWLFYGFDPMPSSLLKKALERRLVPGPSFNMSGSCYTQVRTYRAP